MATFTTPKTSLTWLITGCSSGFGLSLVRAILASGRHTVLATSRNPSKTPELVAEVERSGGRWLPLDVTDPKAGRELIDRLESEGTEIDVLVNNAGFSFFGPVETATDEEVRAQMEVMYFGPLRLIQTALPHMRQRRFGIIVNMSSGASLMGSEAMGPYAGAKAGLDSVTRVLGKEVASFNIRTLTVVLGVFRTNFGGAAEAGSTPLPEDYEGTAVEKLTNFVTSGSFIPDGDPDKAMKGVYDVVVGEGVGKGHEGEIFLPLGKDMVGRVDVVKGYLQSGLDAFRELTTSVNVDK